MSAGEEKRPAGWRLKRGVKGRYRTLSTRMYLDARVRRFDVYGKAVWPYLLNNHHTTALPGIYPLRETTAAEDLGLTLEEFRRGYGQAAREGMVEADWDAGLVWVRNAWKYEPPQNPNQVRGWRDLLSNELPECELLRRAVCHIVAGLLTELEAPDGFREAVAEHLPEPFREPFPQPLPEPFSEPFPKPGNRIQETGNKEPLPPPRAREDVEVREVQAVAVPPVARTEAPPAPTPPLRVVEAPLPSLPVLSERDGFIARIGNLRQAKGLTPELPTRYGPELAAMREALGDALVLRCYANFLETRAVRRRDGTLAVLAKGRPAWPWELFRDSADRYADGPGPEPDESPPPLARVGPKRAPLTLGIAREHAPEGTVSTPESRAAERRARALAAAQGVGNA